MKCVAIEQGEVSCECDGKPLGAGTAGKLSQFYPYGNNSLASIYDTQAYMKDKLIPLSQYKAKAILIGNTASNWGYGPPNEAGFTELLTKFAPPDFQLLLFPCNQFGHQEPGTSECARAYYDVRVPPCGTPAYRYPMFDKVEVNGNGAHELFEYLRRETLDGKEISWNYHKWLVDGATGKVIAHYTPDVSPTAAEEQIRKLIGLRPRCNCGCGASGQCGASCSACDCEGCS
jgi:glutathione peroxidase